MSQFISPMKPQQEPTCPSLADFESGQFDPEAFTHTAHVYVAWELVGQCPLDEAIKRFSRALRQFLLPEPFHNV